MFFFYSDSKNRPTSSSILSWDSSTAASSRPFPASGILTSAANPGQGPATSPGVYREHLHPGLGRPGKRHSAFQLRSFERRFCQRPAALSGQPTFNDSTIFQELWKVRKIIICRGPCVSEILTSLTCFGGLMLGSGQFFLLPNCIENYYSLQKWLNSLLALSPRLSLNPWYTLCK